MAEKGGRGGHRLEVRGRPATTTLTAAAPSAKCVENRVDIAVRGVPGTEVPGTRPPLRYRWLNTGVRRRCHCRGVILLIRAEALQLAPERSAEAVLLRRQRGFPSLQPLPHRGAGRHTRWPPHRTVILESLHW